MRKWECGIQNAECGSGNAECGLRPLRAVGSIYEPEAVGGIGAYDPERRRKSEFGRRRSESGGSQNSHGSTQTHTDIFLSKVALSVFVRVGLWPII